MPAIRRALDARRWVAAVLPLNSLPRPGLAAVGVAVLLTLCVHGAVGATGCTSAPIASAPTPAQCVKAVKGTPKAKAKVSPAPLSAASAAAVAAPGWKSVVDPLPAGDWKYLSDGPSDNPSAVYASSHSIMHNGNVVTAWMRWEFAHSQADVYPLHYLSAVTREELDCDARAYRRAEVVYYTRNNLQEKGASFTALHDDTTWKQAIPGSEPDAMLNWGCTLPAESEHSSAPAKAPKAHKPPSPTAAASSAPPASSAPAATAVVTTTHRP
jgi:hypothetical protein